MKRILATVAAATIVAGVPAVVGTPSALRIRDDHQGVSRIRTVDAVAPVASLRIRRIR